MVDIKPKSCTLRCLQRLHEPIHLPDGTPVTIGRSPLTRIIDPRCSRNQVELTAVWSERKVKVRQLASNNTSIDGVDIGQSKEAVLHVDSTLFILTGQYPHQVVFEEDSSNSSESNGKIDVGTAKGTGEKNPSVLSNSTSDTKENKNRSDKIAKKRSHPDKDKHNHQEVKKRKPSEQEKDKIRTDTERAKIASKKESNTSDEKSIRKDKVSKISSETRHHDEKQEKSDEESEHLQSVQEKLNKMKKHVSQSGKKKSSLDPSTKSSTTSERKEDKSSKIASYSSQKSNDSTSESSWTSHEHLLVYTSKNVTHRNHIAGFDIDGTIIVTKSGKTFPTDSSDWKISLPDIFGKLKNLHKEGYKIIFFTNQLGVARGKVKVEDLKTKIENIVSHLHVPVQVFVATHSGKYRKPMDGMWKKLRSQYNGGISIDLSSSFYVGDAAGRPAEWEPKKKKDFSNSDRLFALNVGVKFYTPEEYFLKRKAAKFTMPTFDPRALPSKGDWLPKNIMLTSDTDTKEIIILVGYPASGKSYFAKNVLKPKGYVVVNRDTLGTWQKCVKMTQESIVNSSVVVDNTNLTQDERARYINCAKKEGVPCRCFILTTSIDHCRHNERFREMNDKSHAVINEMLFNKIKSSYKEPKMNEGFTEIVKVSFIPKFSSASMEAEYRKFLLEK